MAARSLGRLIGQDRRSGQNLPTRNDPMPQRLRRLTDAPVLAKTVLFSLARMGLVTSQSRWVTSSKSHSSPTATLGLRAFATLRDATSGSQAARSAHTPGRAPCLAVRSADQPCGPARDTPNRSDTYPESLGQLLRQPSQSPGYGFEPEASPGQRGHDLVSAKRGTAAV